MPAPKKKKDTGKDDPSKIFDVKKPGQTPADRSSRPIIVGHGAMIQKDPMVAADKSEPASTVHAPGKTKIVPITGKEDELEKTDNDEPNSEKPPESDDDKASEEDRTPNRQDDTSASGPEAAPAGVVDALTDEVGSKREDAKAEAEASKHAEEIEKLVQNRKYFVSIGETSRHRSNRLFIIALLSLVLIAAVLNFAMDAGVVDLGISPLTNLL